MSPEILVFVGRLLLGGHFVVAGVRHLFNLPGLTEAIRARGAPAPRLVLLSGTAFQIVVGLLLVGGFHVPCAAFGLIAFTLAASVLLLNFWDREGPVRIAAINNWQQNAAVIGGLLLAAALGK